jgi:TetR/AcrR family transcriptional regulator, transcriptional repressor for nem operon
MMRAMTLTAHDSVKHRRGEGTRDKFLDAACALMLRHGFNGTTVERVLAQTGLTKGAFFHHFPQKSHLALALIERYAAEGRESLDAAIRRAELASDDPLQQLLFLQRDYIERAQLPTPADAPPAGCLMACVAYEIEEHSSQVRGVMRESVEYFRNVVAAKVRYVMEKYPPRMPVQAEAVAEYLYAIYDGGLVLGRLLAEPPALIRQLQHAENYLQLLFQPTLQQEQATS